MERNSLLDVVTNAWGLASVSLLTVSASPLFGWGAQGWIWVKHQRTASGICFGLAILLHGSPRVEMGTVCVSELSSLRRTPLWAGSLVKGREMVVVSC